MCKQNQQSLRQLLLEEVDYFEAHPLQDRHAEVLSAQDRHAEVLSAESSKAFLQASELAAVLICAGAATQQSGLTTEKMSGVYVTSGDQEFEGIKFPRYENKELDATLNVSGIVFEGNDDFKRLEWTITSGSLCSGPIELKPTDSVAFVT